MILAKKKNMTQLFDAQNNVVPVTILDYSECRVQKGAKNAGNFVCLGTKKSPRKSESGVFGAESTPEVFIKEEDTEKAELETLAVGDLINIYGYSKGRGFAGVMRMWNFKGGKRTHGQSDRERHPGSIGSRTIPGKVFKGKRMGRRKGNVKVTVQGLEIISNDQENKLLCVKGSVPGTYDSVIFITKQ